MEYKTWIKLDKTAGATSFDRKEQNASIFDGQYFIWSIKSSFLD